MKVRLVNSLTRREICAEFKDFEPTGAVARLDFGTMIGLRRTNLNHGYGLDSMKDWRIHPDDLKLLRELAIAKGHKVSPCGRGTGRPRKPCAGVKPHPKQLSFDDIRDINDND